jgi:hypothetical protein
VPELVALRGQVEALQLAATDLVESEDVTAALRRITQRAASAVLAPAYLLAVHGPDGSPLVQSEGLDRARADELGRRLLAGDDLGPGAVVVDVTSRRRSHGRLAALYAAGQQGPANERNMLAAYAGHAAAALDLLVALEESRRGENRSAALLGLAHDLRAATDPEMVGAVVVSTLTRIAGSDSSSLLLWSRGHGEPAYRRRHRAARAAAAAPAGDPNPGRGHTRTGRDAHPPRADHDPDRDGYAGPAGAPHRSRPGRGHRCPARGRGRAPGRGHGRLA